MGGYVNSNLKFGFYTYEENLYNVNFPPKKLVFQVTLYSSLTPQ